MNQVGQLRELFADMQLRALEPRARSADLLDPDTEKPQTRTNGAPPRVNAEFIEGGRVVIGEFEGRAARLPTMVPRDLSGRDRLVSGSAGRVDHYPYPRKGREQTHQPQPEVGSQATFRQKYVGPVDEMRVGDREIVLVEKRRPARHA